MLDANLKAQLKAYLEKVTQPFEIVASLDDSAKSQELLGLLNDIVGLTDKITLKTDGSDARRPSFALNRPGEDTGVAFAGIVAGTDSDTPLALVGESHWAVPFAILIFATVIAGLYARLRGWASRPLS